MRIFLINGIPVLQLSTVERNPFLRGLFILFKKKTNLALRYELLFVTRIKLADENSYLWQLARLDDFEEAVLASKND